MNESSAPSGRELWLVLEAIIAQEGAQHFQAPDGMERDRTMDVVNELLDRRWAEAQAKNAGDGRLLSVRGLRSTSLGKAAMNDLRREALGSTTATCLPIAEKKQRRAELMAQLYGFTGGLALKDIGVDDLAELLGWSVDDTNAVLEYLEKEGLVELLGFGPMVGITHAGVVEVEYALEHPEKPTEHFLPHTVVIVQGDMHGSQIQAGTVASHQEQHVALTDALDEVRAFVDAFRDALSELSDTERAVAEAEIATVDAQIASPRPNAGAVRESLTSLRAIAEGAAGSAVFVGLAALAQHLPI
jgi:hypothetical protein